MLIVVDGTGSSDENEYTKNMKNNFCNKMATEFYGQYNRGPTLNGFETFYISDKIVNDVVENHKKNKLGTLYMAGHSRGGASIIHAARLLGEKGYTIECMYLFDAVDKTLSPKNTKVISRNVKMVYHARRREYLSKFYEGRLSRAWESYFNCIKLNSIKNASESMQKYGVISPALTAAQLAASALGSQFQCAREFMHVAHMEKMDNAMKMRMRSDSGIFPEKIPQSRSDIYRMFSIDFENCGLEHENGISCYQEKHFNGSHGSIGGAFIGDENSSDWNQDDKKVFKELIARDEAASSCVREWMWDLFRQKGLMNHSI